MVPYYDHAGITIYHADCRDVTVSADVLVTDPPYAIDFAGKKTKHTPRHGGYHGGDDPLVGPAVVGALVPTVTRAGVFPGIRQLFRYPEPRDIGCVYCPSGAGYGRFGYACFHPVLFYGSPITNTKPCSLISFATTGPSEHPCPKPEPWMRWLLVLLTKPGDVVLDPFAGSGTTLRAAKDLGRKAIGIEIEEAYCEIAARRLAQEVLDVHVDDRTRV